MENLVKYVKGNFLAGRSFYDDVDLEQQNRQWLHEVNAVRVRSRARSFLPAEMAQVATIRFIQL